jgi:hypothetical protein
MAHKIFISYRRDDSSGYAVGLYDRLTRHFRRDQIFMDISAIEPGADFVEDIKKAVSACDVLIVVIGRQWLTITDDSGRRRLDNPEDFVHLEIATALNRGVRVMPVLVQGAPMPSEQDLPDALAKLARLQAVELSITHWDYDMRSLIKALKDQLATSRAEPINKLVAILSRPVIIVPVIILSLIAICAIGYPLVAAMLSVTPIPTDTSEISDANVAAMLSVTPTPMDTSTDTVTAAPTAKPTNTSTSVATNVAPPSEVLISTPTHPPTITLTPTSTPPPRSTSTPTDTPISTSATLVVPTSSALTLTATSVPLTSATPSIPAATFAPTVSVPNGTLMLLSPSSLDEISHGPTNFEWEWTGALSPEFGFEVRVWREGEVPKGVHNATLDNQEGKIAQIGENKYRLSVDITQAPGVEGRNGEYLWTVLLVQISPGYRELGIQATPSYFRFEAASGGGGDVSPPTKIPPSS